MRILGLALAAAVALVSAPFASAQPYAGMAQARTAIFWHDADRLWSGGMPLEACDQDIILRRADFTPMAAARMATLERRGELIGELRASNAQAPAILTSARACALEAGTATTVPVMLTRGREGWSTFQTAFATCMTKQGTAKSVGSMTLWIDQRCNW
ncbi:hypothetical protein [Phenylobacterium sp.]|uniref:hypothetical protein n=1 Tax=Phenylobacterium sp. TaxID=1871053 RepID=UPI003983D260